MGKKKHRNNDKEDSEKKVPVPKENQVIGIIDDLVGWAHARVKCFDGKERICRVPKKLSRGIWLRRGDYVLVDKWEIQGDKKGDIIYVYSPKQVQWLKENGYLQLEEEEF